MYFSHIIFTLKTYLTREKCGKKDSDGCEGKKPHISECPSKKKKKKKKALCMEGERLQMKKWKHYELKYKPTTSYAIKKVKTVLKHFPLSSIFF